MQYTVYSVQYTEFNYLLIEQENDGGDHEPLVVADTVKQLHALHHPRVQQVNI